MNYNIIANFHKFIKANYSYKKIPYAVINNKVIYDDTEHVRNIATLGEILLISNDTKLINIIKRNLFFYATKIDELNKQSLAFLLLAIYRYDNNYSKKIITILKNSVNDLEPEFELGEVLYSLTSAGVEINFILKHMKQLEQVNTIFGYNWYTKLLLALYKRGYDLPSIAELKAKIAQIIAAIDLNIAETNVLAVIYETLTSLAIIAGKSIDLSFIESQLLARYDKNTGCFKFLNNEIRIDIAGHVIAGLIELLNYNFAKNAFGLYAFDVIATTYYNKKQLSKKILATVAKIKTKFPLFVSWYNNDELIGCIGTFEEKLLTIGIKEYAINAFNDSRFNSRPAIMNKLRVSIEFLINFKETNLAEWSNDKGLIVSANNKKATYLPNVCAKENWSKEECLANLKLKASLVEEVELTSYDTIKFELSYDNYFTEIIKND